MSARESGGPGRKGLRKKIVASILIIGILPLMLGVFLTYLSERKVVTSSIGTNFEAIAKETAGKIEITIRNELIGARNLTFFPDIVETVTRSNRSYDVPPIRRVLNNNVSLYLKKLITYEGDYRAILVTDGRGNLVATTDKDFDYYQGKNQWWQIAYHHGEGRTFVSDIYFDNKAKSYLMEIAVPILTPGEGDKRAIGVIKILYKVDQIFDIIEGVKIGMTGHANLISSSGVIIICPIFPPQSHIINAEVIREILTKGKGWSIAEDDGHGGRKSIIGFAPVRFANQLDRNSSVNKGWYIFIRQNPYETYTPVYNLLLKISLSGLLLIGIFTLTGYYAANRIVEPILLLKEEAGLIGTGNLEHRVRIHTGDEIESLAEEFNQMAERLKESISQSKRERDKLELILLSAGEGIVVADSENRVIMINPVAEEILGVTQKEVLGKSIFPCHKNPERVAEVVNQEVSLPFSIITSIDSKIVEINVTALKSEQGLIGSVMVMKDITSLKKMEQDLKHYSVGLERMVEERTREIKKTKEYLENLLENASDVIFTADLKGNITYINQKVSEWGYDKDELVGKPVDSLLLLSGGPKMERTGEIIEMIKETYEVKIKDKNGNLRDAVISTSPLKDDREFVSGFLGIARDVTERKKIQEQMSRAEKLAAVGQLSMGIAHEINNPLSGMLNCVSTLAKERYDESLQKKYLALIEKGLNRIAYIVRQLLGFAKEYQFEFTPHNLDNLIMETVDLVRHKIERGNIHLQLHLNSHKKRYLLPGNHIQQVILNIAMNAVQAMPDGGTLTIRSREEKNDLVVIISDTGIGIPRENLDQIFDPFFTTKDVGIGTGLGLSLSYGIIEKLGGQIEVSSEVGKGSTFKVTIPGREA